MKDTVLINDYLIETHMNSVYKLLYDFFNSTGTILPEVFEAKERNFGILVMNTNDNKR